MSNRTAWIIAVALIVFVGIAVGLGVFLFMKLNRAEVVTSLPKRKSHNSAINNGPVQHHEVLVKLESVKPHPLPGRPSTTDYRSRKSTLKKDVPYTGSDIQPLGFKAVVVDFLQSSASQKTVDHLKSAGFSVHEVRNQDQNDGWRCGYLAARVVTIMLALQKAGKDLTRETYSEALDLRHVTDANKVLNHGQQWLETTEIDNLIRHWSPFEIGKSPIEEVYSDFGANVLDVGLDSTEHSRVVNFPQIKDIIDRHVDKEVWFLSKVTTKTKLLWNIFVVSNARTMQSAGSHWFVVAFQSTIMELAIKGAANPD